MQKLELKPGKALIVVAHPDDETIWMGGTILRYPSINWTIFSLCRKNDPDRRPKFLRVSKLYHARGVISDLEDEGILTLEESLPEIEKRIRRELKEKKYDYIFTHGLGGEYGHLRHKGVNLVVKKMVQGGGLATKNLFFFSYKRERDREFCVPDMKSDFYLQLSKKEFKIKRDIIKKFYGFSKFSFENRLCAKIETFNKFR